MTGVTLSKREMCVGNVRQGYHHATGKIFICFLPEDCNTKERESFRFGRRSSAGQNLWHIRVRKSL